MAIKITIKEIKRNDTLKTTIRLTFALIALVVFTTSASFANDFWGATGHRVVAKIATDY